MEAGKSFEKKKEKDNSGIQPRSESKGKSLDASSGELLSAAPWEYCSHTPAGELPTDSNCSSPSEFPKDMSEECQGQV